MSNELQTVQTALDYIERHMYEAIDGVNIAHACGLSVRHLYRLFSEYTGHTLKHYLRTRRLTLASQALIQSNASIIDVAFSHQFQSPEVFTRAFRRVFWMTPSQYRKIGCSHNITQQPHLSVKLLEYARHMSHYEPKIEHFDVQYFHGVKTQQRHFGLRTQKNWHQVQLHINSIRKKFPQMGIWQMFSRKGVHGFHNFDTVACSIGVLQTDSNHRHQYHNNNKHDSDKQWICEPLPPTAYAKFPYNDCCVPYETMLQHAYRWLQNSPFGHADAPTLFQSTSTCGRFGVLLLPITDTEILSSMKWWHDYGDVLKTGLAPKF